MLQLNPCLMENIMDLMIYILSPIIILENFHILFGLCLNQGFQIFEVLKDHEFFLEKVDPSKTREIINKNENKTHFVDGWMWKRTHKVTVDHI